MVQEHTIPLRQVNLNIVALAGGVGGARFADGLAQVLHPEHLTIIVNTGDDFSHLGLRISPDLDTVCNTLAGIENSITGWGRQDESWRVFNILKDMGLPDWFQLGDTDLATHLYRSFRLTQGYPLSKITHDICRILGVKATILPMSDDIIQTWVYTDEGDLEFQEYFVHRQSKPAVRGFKFEGIEKSHPAPGITEAIDQCDAIIVCPSNPWVSIDPILNIPNIRQAVLMHPVYSVSPIIGNKTVKGPAAKMFAELGIEPSAFAIAQHYQDLLDYLVIDNCDECQAKNIHDLGIQTLVTDILMYDRADRGRLARELIDIIKADQRIKR